MKVRPGYVALLFMAAAFGASGQRAMASLTAYEGFGPSFPIYANGGTGFQGPWAADSSSLSYASKDSSLCYTKLQSTGGSVSGTAAPSGGLVFSSAGRTLAAAVGATGTTMYLGFLVQPQGTLNEGDANGFFGLVFGSLFVGKSGGGVLDQYVLETVGGTGQVTSGAPTVVGRTALLVVKAQFLSGDDQFTLYTDPTPGRPEPASSVVKTDLDVGGVSSIAIFSTGSFAIDEIRIGTTFADVVPPSDGKACR